MNNKVDLNSKLELAIGLALDVHKDQVDKGGKPYILHPLSVMLMCDTTEEQIVGVLHDAIEDSDSPIAIELYIESVFSEEVVEAIKCLTRRDGVSYNQYLRDVKSNELARKVKLKDLEHNMDLSRLDVVTDRDYDRLNKYERAVKFLVEEC